MLVVPTRLWWPLGSGVVFGTLFAWNIWHTLLQRHGIARAYAVKGGGGLEERAHSRRDLHTLLALAACTAVVVVMFRQNTFYGRAQHAFDTVHVMVARAHPAVGWAFLVGAAMVAAAMVLAWIRAEALASPRVGRIPRLLFWGSSLCLLGVFVVHGAVVGYLVFGFAHAVEYVLFVYWYSHRRIGRGETAPSVRLFGRAIPLVIVSAILLAVFLAAQQVWTLPLFACVLQRDLGAAFLLRRSDLEDAPPRSACADRRVGLRGTTCVESEADSFLVQSARCVGCECSADARVDEPCVHLPLDGCG